MPPLIGAVVTPRPLRPPSYDPIRMKEGNKTTIIRPVVSLQRIDLLLGLGFGTRRSSDGVTRYKSQKRNHSRCKSPVQTAAPVAAAKACGVEHMCEQTAAKEKGPRAMPTLNRLQPENTPNDPIVSGLVGGERHSGASSPAITQAAVSASPEQRGTLLGGLSDLMWQQTMSGDSNHDTLDFLVDGDDREQDD
ncbi:hypothetical protein F2P81_012449 [Scophthalmus maximus]|uniref:Uncharacterized protein n=1 Tax=Scophthalmus maximus TaxID=52904 RepID=A0A6A4SUH1_SCOMX|nr:hypothetical protein F2P81_012449 [Scophthalmus maximus]